MEFIFGSTQLIKGFELGLAELSSGDIAEIGIRSDHGYGKRGQAHDVAPNEDLFFKVEVHEVDKPD